MNRKKLAFAAIACVLCFACESKKEVDFSIVPVKGSNGEYQYIDIAQNGKIVINPQFGKANIFRDGLALVKTSDKDGKWGYIDKKGKYVVAPTYIYAQDFSDGVAWVQLENQPPMLIDKEGKTVLQIDSLMSAIPFNDGIAKTSVFSKGEELKELIMFINKKGESVFVTAAGEDIGDINDGLYSFEEQESGKWGYKDKNGEIVVNPKFDDVAPFFDGIAVFVSGDRWGAVDKKGDIVINPQYDTLSYDGNGLFIAKVGKKWGWVNKKGETVINPQFDATAGYCGGELAPVQMGSKWAYIDKKGQIAINPQFALALPFNGNYAMVMSNEGKIGFVNKKGDFAVQPLYDVVLDDVFEYSFASAQNALNFPVRYQYLGYKYFRYKWNGNTSGIPKEYLDYLSDGRFPNYERLDEKHKEWVKEKWLDNVEKTKEEAAKNQVEVATGHGALGLIVTIDNEYLEIQARGSSMPIFYKQVNSDLVVIRKESAEDAGEVQMSVYSKNDSAYLDRNNQFISSLNEVRPGAVVATLSENSSRRLACGQSGYGIEDICSDGKPAIALKPRRVYDELAKMLIWLHNRLIDSPDADEIIIVFGNDTDNNKITDVAGRAIDAGFFKVSLAKKDNIVIKESAYDWSDIRYYLDMRYHSASWHSFFPSRQLDLYHKKLYENIPSENLLGKARKKAGAGGKPRGKGQPNAPQSGSVLKMLTAKTQNDGYAEGGSGDMLGGLTGSKSSIKAPSEKDIDMGGDASRSKQEIMQVANARMPGLRNIYNKYLKLKPSFSGKVTLKFTISPGGDVISISIVSSTTGYAEFDNAVKNMIATWKWKAIMSGNTTATVPFDFKE